MTTDLAIFRGQGNTTTASWASPGMSLQGSAKLVTRVASLLFSPYDPVRGRGTNFITLYNAGFIRTTAQVQQQFAIAAATARAQLGDQTENPESETVVAITLNSAAISTNYAASIVATIATPNGSIVIKYPLKGLPT